MLRVGHKGADLLVPGNTRESFDAALETGVDMIEFDVLSERPDGSGELFAAHDYEVIRDGSALTFAQALVHLSDARFDHVALIVDVKLPGYELRVLDALPPRLVRRSMISSPYPSTLATVRRHEPDIRVSWSVPRVRRDYTTDLLTKIPALAIACGYRAWLPGAARRGLLAGRFHALTAHWRLVDRRLLRAVVQEGGGELYVWTVDDAARIGRLRALGVSGVISNDPRLFAVS